MCKKRFPPPPRPKSHITRFFIEIAVSKTYTCYIEGLVYAMRSICISYFAKRSRNKLFRYTLLLLFFVGGHVFCRYSCFPNMIHVGESCFGQFVCSKMSRKCLDNLYAPKNPKIFFSSVKFFFTFFKLYF